jgi:hypothetical protein
MKTSAKTIFDRNEAGISLAIGNPKSVKNFHKKYCGDDRAMEYDFWAAVAAVQRKSFVEGFETAVSLLVG